MNRNRNRSQISRNVLVSILTSYSCDNTSLSVYISHSKAYRYNSKS